MSSDHIAPLSDQVRQTSFQDARGTSHDPILLGPPSLEFAPYAKTPGHRARKDARQGTIDQDPDFISFLESLTQPITKPAIVDTIESEEMKEAVITTPLVQFIKDKKASKAKDSSSSKSSKHGRSEKDSKEKVQTKKLLQRERADKDSSPASSSEKKGKGEKTTKESVKAAKQAAAATTTSKSSKASGSNANKESAAPEKKRERGNIAAATKILQRDLGIAPSGGRRRGKGANETASPKNESSRDSSAPAAETTKKEPPAKPSKNAANKGKEKETTNGKQSENSTPSTNKPAKAPKGNAKPKPADTPASTSTQAFLKHANPSQGVTEALLETAFGAFGAVTKVEIDKKKGFGYVDFTTPEGLQKAIAASPVTVAQSQVVVLERKANPGGEKTRKGRGDAPAAPKAKTGEGSGAPNATGSTARGSRGGRGSRNKGAKGGAAAGGAGNAEKAQEKTEKNGSADK